MNKTLQDGLVKELRLHGISTMEAGNAFAPEFMADYNQRLERTPRASEPQFPVADGLSEVASFLERFEAEQKARQKAQNDRTALRRKALAQG